MSEEALRAKLARMQRRIDLLESMIEDRSRDLFVANEKLRSLLRDVYRTMPGAVIVFGRDDRVEVVNDIALRLLEYTEEEITGRTITTLFAPDGAPTFAMIEAELAQKQVFRAEKICLTKRGKPIPVLFSASLRTGEATPPGVVSVALDIRDRKKLEVELRQAQKLESVGRLAAGVAHEINTPMQFVMDSVQFVRGAFRDLAPLLAAYDALHRASDPSSGLAAEVAAARDAADLDYLVENVPDALARSEEGLKRIAEIVRSLREFAHPERKAVTTVDLNQAIASTLTIARNEYKYVAEVETEFGELPPITCRAGELNQAILNIVVNAGHAIADVVNGSGEKGRITVKTHAEGEHVVVSIGDTGGGIPDEIRERVFDPFFTTKEVGRGTGQGLAIARSVIVDKHGGELTFDTRVGSGTTFKLKIPVRHEAPADKREP